MTLRGHIHNGALVLDEPVAYAEGAQVECVVLNVEPPPAEASCKDKGCYEDLLAFAGIVTDLPEDVSEQIDHYVYGHPKQ